MASTARTTSFRAVASSASVVVYSTADTEGAVCTAGGGSGGIHGCGGLTSIFVVRSLARSKNDRRGAFVDPASIARGSFHQPFCSPVPNNVAISGGGAPPATDARFVWCLLAARRLASRGPGTELPCRRKVCENRRIASESRSSDTHIQLVGCGRDMELPHLAARGAIVITSAL